MTALQMHKSRISQAPLSSQTSTFACVLVCLYSSTCMSVNPMKKNFFSDLENFQSQEMRHLASLAVTFSVLISASIIRLLWNFWVVQCQVTLSHGKRPNQNISMRSRDICRKPRLKLPRSCLNLVYPKKSNISGTVKATNPFLCMCTRLMILFNLCEYQVNRK